MILPDLNLLIYAHNTSAPQHSAARFWWDEVTNGPETVGLPWVVALGFVRLLSNPAVVERPDPPAQLLGLVGRIISRVSVRLVNPGPRHPALMAELFARTGGSFRLVTDVHLAALAIELNAVLASNDADFTRFPGLKLVNPLKDARRHPELWRN